jgi:hypothetical protein
LNDDVLGWISGMRPPSFESDEDWDLLMDSFDSHFNDGKQTGLGKEIDLFFSNPISTMMIFTSFMGGWILGRKDISDRLKSMIEADVAIKRMRNVGKESNQA